MSTGHDSKTFERIVRPHFDRLYRLAWRLAASKPEAEDLFQEVLVRAFDKLDDLVQVEDPAPWLSRVMYNLFVDQKRRFARTRLRFVEEGQLAGDGIEGLAGPGSPDYDKSRFDTAVRLQRALDQLSDEHRIVVLMHDAEGYKITEIEAIAGVPAGTVKSRLHRARARLRKLLEADGTFS